MLRSLAFAFAWGLAGYLIGAFGGGWLITKLSSNMHDRSTEAAMTGAFVLGPLGSRSTMGMAASLSRRTRT